MTIESTDSSIALEGDWNVVVGTVLAHERSLPIKGTFQIPDAGHDVTRRMQSACDLYIPGCINVPKKQKKEGR